MKHLTRAVMFAAIAIGIGIVLALAVTAYTAIVGTDVAPAPEPVQETQEVAGKPYTSIEYGFSVRYPDGYAIDEDLGPGIHSPGVAFRVPAAYTTGTNLSTDSGLLVERAEGQSCSAELFIDADAAPETVTEGGRTWSVGRSGDAGAGNLYENVVYATESGGYCYGLRHFVHSTQLANYEPGTRRAFDRAAFDSDYAAFRASFAPAP